MSRLITIAALALLAAIAAPAAETGDNAEVGTYNGPNFRVEIPFVTQVSSAGILCLA